MRTIGRNKRMSQDRIEKLLDLGHGLWIARAHVDDLREQDLNARVMSKEMFDQGIKNVKKRGYLESLPYCVYTERGCEIISGHHRVRWCRSAGIMQIYILLDTNKLSRDEIIARQLAHNSINGYDDKEMLKRLFEAINDVDLRLETFIAPKDLDLDLDAKVPLIDIAPTFDFKTVMLTFLPSQLDDFSEVLSRLNGDEYAIGVAPVECFAKFREAVLKVQKTENIKSIGMALARISEFILQHYDELQKGEEKVTN